ncbi:quinone oxidoreductase-like protein 1 isoform X2 [Syngnathoides biaculeatus]|uniref:quinone oxidoreductase-like protein 1 isoform X2 n=1 Tax=Syngnathoides biaculeatus TaxID=300417 RepID=UPI002ADDDC79|nr:quinone oxidoreductase-like protein 1 isoform X2 [Syngnathoides biaculeatus]
MKGLFCRINGSELKFVTQETTLPEVLGGHDVRIHVKACGLSPLDLKFLEDMGLQGDAIPLGREVTGIVQRVGPKVTFFQPDDEVVGILPLDSVCSGLSDVIDINEQYLVEKPSKLSCTSVAAALEDGLRAYTALHTHARMAAGQTLLVLDGASSFGLMCIQLASYHGVKVLTTSRSQEQHSFLEQLRPSVGVQEPLVARVIPVHKNPSKLLPAVLEETGGLGVDIVVDQGVSLREKEQPEEEEEEEEEEEAATFLPHKHDIISVLAVGGHWVTSQQDLQLDPPDSRLMFLKSASVSFLNSQVWLASSSQQGRYLHILRDIVEKMSSGVLRPQPEEAVPLQDAAAAMENVQLQHKKKAVVEM